MRQFIVFLSVLLLGACANVSIKTDFGPDPEQAEWRLAIHGGAGVITRENMTSEKETAYRAALDASLQAGADILKQGGSAVDAVQAAVLVMENDELFNAGRGAVFTASGGHELDAAIMDGAVRNAGAVAGVTRVKNPILAARAVMDNSEHVMFAGAGADEFASQQGLTLVKPDYFSTERRRKSLERVLQTASRSDEDRHGTVGAVAFDRDGNVAAATSTGGMTAKAHGRIGDSPLIGASTYAQNGVCAVSATGHGEYFIRVGVAKAICARVELSGQAVKDAADDVLAEVAALGGDGGVILMDSHGRPYFSFNSKGMYRGQVGPDGASSVIFGD